MLLPSRVVVGLPTAVEETEVYRAEVDLTARPASQRTPDVVVASNREAASLELAPLPPKDVVKVKQLEAPCSR